MRRLVVGLLRLAAIIGGGGLAVAFTLAAIAPRLGDIFAANESASAEIDLNELALRSIVYDMHGDEFDVLYDVENRELVDLDDISHAMIMSLLVVEDEGFYDHNGVDAKAIGRAFIENVNAGGIEQGGSTITQQLIKNGVLSSEQQLERKIPEAALAIRLENQLTKDEILEAYLNTVYFGSGAYGVRAAAEIYFGVSPDRLTWPQGALLAGLIANPDRYDPTRFPDIADERRTVALLRLLETGNITDEQYARYVDAPLPTERRVPAEWEPTSYFIEEVRRQLLEDPRLGATFDERADLLFGGGLRVFTTYDPAAQTAAEAAVEAHLPDDERGFSAAVAAVEPGTGRVRAIVGGPVLTSSSSTSPPRRGVRPDRRSSRSCWPRPSRRASCPPIRSTASAPASSPTRAVSRTRTRPTISAVPKVVRLQRFARRPSHRRTVRIFDSA